jgi:hypothetical protein
MEYNFWGIQYGDLTNQNEPHQPIEPSSAFFLASEMAEATEKSEVHHGKKCGVEGAGNDC